MFTPIRGLHRDSLFRNSFYLMLATVTMAGFGFFFWLINARLFSTYDIGLATTLISVMNLVAIFSLAGFDSTFIRFLPASHNKNDIVNTGLIVVGSVAFLISSLFVVFIAYISPSLMFVHSPLFGLMFIFGCMMNAVNVLTEAVFVAYRQTKYALMITGLFSFVKMVLPFAFIGWGVAGIFGAAALSQTVGLFASLILLSWKFDYRPKFILYRNILTNLWRYSSANYAAGVLNLVPVTFLPVIITNRIGAEASAYYYIAMMIAGVLYTIPMSVARSSFAESSHDEAALERHVRTSSRIIALLMLPAILILIFGRNEILHIFGKNYTSGADFLALLALSGIAVGALSVFNTFFKVTRHLQYLICSNAVYAGGILTLSYVFLPYGLIGIGYAWLIGNVGAALVGYVLYRRAVHMLAMRETRVD